MPERNDEMSLREALIGAVTAEPEGAPDPGMSAEGDPTVGAAETSAVPVEEGVNAPETVPSSNETDPAMVAEKAPNAAETPVGNVAVPGGNTPPASAEMWQAFNQLMAENRQLKAERQQMNAAMQQQSDAAEGAIMRQFTPQAAMPKATAPQMDAPPVLNMQEIGYLPPEEQQKHISQWQQAAMEYAMRSAAAQIKEEVAREFAPVKENWETNRRIAENEAAKATLFGMPQFADLKEKAGDIEKIIASTPILKGASPDQKYLLAALISRGMNAQKKPTTEDLINMASANPDVMKALEARRVAEIQQNNQALPKVVPSSGMGNANPVPEVRPKTSEDVRMQMLKALGVR